MRTGSLFNTSSRVLCQRNSHRGSENSWARARHEDWPGGLMAGFQVADVHKSTGWAGICTGFAACLQGRGGLGLWKERGRDGAWVCTGNVANCDAGIRAVQGCRELSTGKWPVFRKRMRGMPSKYKILWFVVDIHHRERYFFICGCNQTVTRHGVTTRRKTDQAV